MAEPMSLYDYLKSGAERIEKRNAWLDHLANSPDAATQDDVLQLVDRIRKLEKEQNELYLEGYCVCFASLRRNYDRYVEREKSKEKSDG